MAVGPSYSGKVRDVYDLGDGRLVMVASDRISAFDVVLADPVPGKGRVLTGLSAFWLAQLADLAPHHLISTDPADFAGLIGLGGESGLGGRAMLVRKAEMLPIECIVRGYLSGSAWKEYRTAGTVHGTALASGLVESDRFPEPLFTPSTKATSGHDQNISVAQAAELIGWEAVQAAEEISLGVYRRGAAWAEERGIVIADTKLELGYIDGRLSLCDEVLTPDSSRLWPTTGWSPGTSPPSFDKQPVRDWLEASGWDKRPPPPRLPSQVVAASAQRYADAFARLTGRPLASWDGTGAWQ